MKPLPPAAPDAQLPARVPSPARRRALGWLLLILLVAAGLRLVALADVPPGFTHDEADHGLDAWGVVNGIRPLYFTVGYGREPLFDYSTAGLMAFLGPTYLAGRLTAVFYSLILVAGTYAWTRRAFNRRVALLTAAGLAVSFWGVMTGRHALRSVTMPALFTLAAAAFWDGMGGRRGAWGRHDDVGRRDDGGRHKAWGRHKAGPYVACGVLLGATFYAYLPARILWVLFPGLLGYWALFRREALRRRWRGTLVALLVAGVVAAPLLIYLQTNPGAEIRLTQLSGPLDAALAGDWAPLWRNLAGAARLFTAEGDSLWRYNIPGKPWLGPVMGALFYAGLLLAVVQIVRRLPGRDGAVFALAWLVAGMAPALITGPEASMTRAIAMQPVLYLFPALTLSAACDWAAPRLGRARRAAPVLALLLFGAVAAGTARDYFVTWANHPEVRVQYESTLVAAINYLNHSDDTAVALSTATPDRFHSPSTALMTLRNPDVQLRWFNGDQSLVLPAAPVAAVIFPGFAPLNRSLAPFFAHVGEPEVLPLRRTDIDRPLAIYRLRPDVVLTAWKSLTQPLDATLGDVATLTGYALLTPQVGPGDMVELVTTWQVLQPAPGLVLFTHLPDEQGVPLAQADRLDVPSFYWAPGDHFAQLHSFVLPADLPEGDYPLRIGGYICAETPCETTPTRLSIGAEPEQAGDFLRLPQALKVRHDAD